MTKKLLVFFLFMELAVSPAFADQVDRASAQFFESVMSPYCPGMTLSACPSDDARLLRDEIRAKLASGVEEESLKAELKGRFGNLTGEPKAGINGGLAYIGILVFFAIGLGIIGFVIRKNGNKENVQAES